MMNHEMLGEYAVEYGGTKVGKLIVSQAGLKVQFSCVCVVACREVLRLAILCGERYVVLGVLFPDGDKLRFRKSYSRHDLQTKGLHAIDGCRLVTKQDVLPTPIKPAAPEPESVPESKPEAAPEPNPTPPEPVPESPPAPVPIPKPNLVPTPLFIPASAPLPTPIPEPDNPATPLPVPDPEPTSAPESMPIPEPIPPPEPTPAPVDPPSEPPPEPGGREPNFIFSDADVDNVDPYPTPPETSQSTSPTWTPVTRIEAGKRPDTAWTPITDLGSLFTDPELQAASQSVTGAMIRKQMDCTELAIPFAVGTPFPLMPIFCFGRSAEIDGSAYLVFQIKNGNLVGSRGIDTPRP